MNYELNTEDLKKSNWKKVYFYPDCNEKFERYIDECLEEEFYDCDEDEDNDSIVRDYVLENNTHFFYINKASEVNLEDFKDFMRDCFDKDLDYCWDLYDIDDNFNPDIKMYVFDDDICYWEEFDENLKILIY